MSRTTLPAAVPEEHAIALMLIACQGGRVRWPKLVEFGEPTPAGVSRLACMHRSGLELDGWADFFDAATGHPTIVNNRIQYGAIAPSWHGWEVTLVASDPYIVPLDDETRSLIGKATAPSATRSPVPPATVLRALVLAPVARCSTCAAVADYNVERAGKVVAHACTAHVAEIEAVLTAPLQALAKAG